MNILIIFVASICSVSATYYLKHHFEMNTVRASAITIITGCGIQHFIHLHFSIELLDLPYVICGASFCGMSSTNILRNVSWVLICGFIYAWIFILSIYTLKGIGGALGAGACVAVLTSYGLMLLVKQAEKIMLIPKRQ